MNIDTIKQNKKIYENVTKIKNIVLVMSGKGGVGKSTITVNYAISLKNQGKKVGILDMDISGANIPLMLKIQDKIHEPFDEENILPVDADGIKVSSMALVGYKDSSALVWRSPVKTQIIRQLLADVIWGDLDYLVIDTPAGTGDEILTLAQSIIISGAIIVSEPTKVSLLDAKKSISFCKEASIPIFGIIENMAYMVCENCNTTKRLVKDKNVDAVAKEFEVDVLGSLPLDFDIFEKGDGGVIEKPSKESVIFAKTIDEITQKIEEKLKINEEIGLYEYQREDYKSAMLLKPSDDAGDFQPVR